MLLCEYLMPPRIFISYRRDDAAGDAGRLADHLNRRFGRGQVFLDIDTIDPGADFVGVLQSSLRETAAVLVVIGQRWTSARDSSGARRLDNAKDFVRLEVEESLSRDIPVVPVLVQGAAMPKPEDLPPSMASLTTRQAVTLDHAEFHDDANRLCDHLEKMIGSEKASSLSALKRWWPAAVVGLLSVGLIGYFAMRTLGPKQIGADATNALAEDSRAQGLVAAAEAQRDLANINLERFRGLREKGVTSQAEYDRATAEAKQAEARVGEIGATIERKTIRAPFAGILGIRQVNLGQYLSGGDPVVPLQTLHPIYVNFAVPQQEVAALVVGAEVRLTLEGKLGVEFPGKITAINSIVDEATRNVEVQATFANADGTLRPGMFVETQVVVGAGTPMIALPASSVQYAPYGNTVFLVEEIKGKDGKSYLGVRQQFVKLGSARGDQVAVLSGVEPGAQVVTSGVFKLRNGAAVQVNNEVQPGNNPSPQPEDS